MVNFFKKIQNNDVLNLEQNDSLRVSLLLKEYIEDYANRVSIILPDQPLSFGAFIDFSIEIDLDNVILLNHTEVEVVRVSVDLPPTFSLSSVSQELSLNAIRYSVKRGDNDIKDTSINLSNGRLAIVVQTDELMLYSGKLTVTINTPSLFFILPERITSKIHLLNFNLKIPIGTNKTLFFLDHATEVSLRCRKDNSEYQSLAYSIQQGFVRKITFFRDNIVKVRYYYGIADISELLKPTMPLFAFGISLLAGGITLALIHAHLNEIAATAFALLILPPFLHLIISKRIYYTSTDINYISINQIVNCLVGIIYIPISLLTIASLVLLIEYQELAMKIDLIAGIVLILCGGTYSILINYGALQHYMCDNCERRIILRRSAKLDIKSRKTLCQDCWLKHVLSSL